MKALFRIAGLLAALSLLPACSIFSGKDKELPPAELVDIQTTLDVRKVWSASLGGSADYLRVALRPVGDVDRIYAASHDGNVSAFNPETGKRFWRTSLDTELSAGPGFGQGVLVVTSSDGGLIVLDATTGVERWRTNIGGESLAQPLIHEDLIVILTIDNRLRAFSLFDGIERWSVEQSAPLLTIRGSSTPVVVGSTVIAGFDNGRLMAVNIFTGDVEWEAPIAPPSGRSDLERLSDVDGGIAVVGQDVYAAGYHGDLVALAAESGQPLWTRDVSSFMGVSADWNYVYTVTEDGEIVAISRLGGSESWRQISLLRREPTLPVTFSTAVATGDFEGYVHFFNSTDGVPAARLKVSGQVSGTPLVIAERLYVQSDAGDLTAFAVRHPKKPRKAAQDTDEGS